MGKTKKNEKSKGAWSEVEGGTKDHKGRKEEDKEKRGREERETKGV